MVALDNLIKVFSLARGLLALLGLASFVVVALPATRGTLLMESAHAAVDSADAAGAPPVLAATGPIRAAEQETAEAREQRAVAGFIARRYRVSGEASSQFVQTAYRAGREFEVDPLLILAVMAVESRYNPVAESSMGAMGLMQVIPRFHPEKLDEDGGERALLDPEVNIRVGAEILREYLGRFGETEAALQKYAGAFDEPTAQYAGKVMAEKARLQQFLARSLRKA
jgi:soluble lytic murein transglycosylase-like protein